MTTPSTPLDLDRIEAAAREASTRSPWRVVLGDGKDVEGHPVVYGIYGPEDHRPAPEQYGGPDKLWDYTDRVVETDAGFYEPKFGDATHIATSNPATVLALVARVRELEQGLSSAVALLDESRVLDGGVVAALRRLAEGPTP